jgi:Fe-S oxidoreductase/nitrate reductase gamma subunit
MIPERVDFWGISQPWGPVLVYSTLTLAVVILLARLFWQNRHLMTAQKRGRIGGDWLLRSQRVFRLAFLQWKVAQEKYPAAMHLALSVSFGLLFVGTALATLNGHFFQFLSGNTYLVYKLILDLASIGFLVGAGLALYRRLAIRPQRLTLARSFLFTLILLSFIVLNGLIVESLRLAILQPAWQGWAPVGWLVSQAWVAARLSLDALHNWHQVFYGLHVVSVAVFLITLPDTNLVHVFSAPLNIFFANPLSGAQLPAMAVSAAGLPAYVQKSADLGLKPLLGGEACTECGRCQDVCPAFSAGLPLNPKEIILTIRNVARRHTHSSLLAGHALRDDMLWACMACGACAEICPVSVEHVDAIVDLRRSLVYAGKIEPALQNVLGSIYQLGNSENKPRRDRCSWVKQLAFPIKDARTEPVDLLWMVGDALGFSAEMAQIALQTAQVFQKAGLSFGILYAGEENDGNDLRRIGEEGLFQDVVKRNSQVLQQCSFQRIVTTDPHLYNTVKHEYPPKALHGAPVLHYSELLEQLLAQGKLSVIHPLSKTVTYHDPCYLSRFNGVINPSRRVLSALGCQVIEMAHCKAQTMCCGAGGGRIWMSEGEMVQRPSERRMAEALEIPGVTQFVVACPKDWMMFTDAAGGRIEVKDLIELVHEAVGD